MSFPQPSYLESIIASAMDAIISVDADQRIPIFNAAAEAMFRCSSADVISQPLDRFIPERFRAGHRVYPLRFGRTGETPRHIHALGRLLAVRADGTEFPMEASISETEIAGDTLHTVIFAI